MTVISPLDQLLAEVYPDGTPAQPQGRLTRTIPEAAAILGIPARTLYRLARQGDVESVRIGGRVYMTLAVINRMLEPASLGTKS
jgi:excisionase family DNA binding protein